MKETRIKKYTLFFSIIAVAILTIAFLSVRVNETAFAENRLAETRADLLKAIKNADDGDVILVGDVDFTMEGGGAKHESERLVIDKNVTIKSGKESGKAHFTGGSFLIDGTKVAGVKSVISFENIVFDGSEDVTEITGEDWELTYDEGTGDPVSNYTLKAQYAIMCKGNVKAFFGGCEFNGYMHEQGAAVRLFYGDYSGNDYALYEYGDNSTCTADLAFTACTFKNNLALFGGGAVYAEANKKNVSLSFADTVFQGNVAGINDYSPGGGAICVSDVDLELTGCRLINNTNVYYDNMDEPYPYDESKGGGVYCFESVMKLTDCVFTGNEASQGGALAALSSTGDIEGCVFDGNVASPHNAPDIKSLASCGGKGGAIFFNNPESVSLTNVTITRNVAENAYGAVATDYSKNLENVGYGARKLEFIFCTVADNAVNAALEDFYFYGDETKEWNGYPGDFWSISYVYYKCSIIIDETVEVYDRNEEATADNGYCYFGSPEQADSDGYIREYGEKAGRLTFADMTAVPQSYSVAEFPDREEYIKGDIVIGASESAEILYKDPAPEPIFGPDEDPDEGTDKKSESAENGGKKDFPVYAIILIVLGGMAVISGAFAAFVLIMKKKKIALVSEVAAESGKNAEENGFEGKTRLDEGDIEKILSDPILDVLSDREKEVLSAVLSGKKRKDIAEELFISESTVKKHIASIYTKLNVSSRAELMTKLYFSRQ